MSHFFLLSQVNPGDDGLLVLGVSPGLCGFRGWPDQKTLGGWQLGSVGCSETARRRQGDGSDEGALIGSRPSTPQFAQLSPFAPIQQSASPALCTSTPCNSWFDVAVIVNFEEEDLD